jgi:hypothetical protein
MKLFTRSSLILGVLGMMILLTTASSNTLSKNEAELLVKNSKEAEHESVSAELHAKEAELESAATELEKKKHKKAKLKLGKSRSKQIPTMALIQNDSLTNSTYREMNYTFVKQELNEFREQNKKWDYKLLDKQFDDIYNTMLLRQMPYKTLFGDRAYMQIFLNYFTACDSNKDNVLDLGEFTGCMGNDTYLNRIKPPSNVYAAQVNYTDPNFFYQFIFNTLDTLNSGTLNFHAYMELRLFIFSWRKCSVVSPFLDETSWECAIDIVSGLKTPSRPTLRNTYYMCLEISNSQRIRNIDFISYLMFASSARLYGRINGKTDGDVTSKNKFF